MKRLDVIVVGLGAVGSSTLYQCAKNGVKVLGIDQFSPPHSFGSSHGDTRIIRQAIGEGDQYVDLVLRSYKILEELEQKSGKKLLEKCGGLIISNQLSTAVNHVENLFENTVRIAKKYSIKHEVLNSDELKSRFSQFNIDGNERGYFESHAGFVRPEECISVQLDLAKEYGACIKRNQKVLDFKETEDGILVTTNLGNYFTKKLILTVGPWISDFLPDEYRPLFKVVRQMLFWFDIKGSIKKFEQGNFPVFIWEVPGDKKAVYGFPALDGEDGGLKITSEEYGTTSAMSNFKQEVSQEEIERMYKDFVKPYFFDLGNKCVKATSCFYTVTPDSHFLIDYLPNSESVLIASACSGHGFKHSLAVGEILKQLAVEGKSNTDISFFSWKRLFKK